MLATDNTTWVTCPDCCGTGEDDESCWDACSRCEGTGVINDIRGDHDDDDDDDDTL